MEKRNFKQFFRAYGGVIGFVIWLFLISVSVASFGIQEITIQTSIILSAITIIYTIVGIKLMLKSFDKEEQQKQKDKKQRLQELENQYRDYIDLVDNQLRKTLNKFENSFSNSNEILNSIRVDRSLEYLDSFDCYKKWICEDRIVGEPDSFIVASCLMYSIIDNPVLVAEQQSVQLEEIQFGINIDIAMRCAFQIIAEPTTYYKNELGIWIEEKHPKVDIVVPEGIIKNSKLYQRIVATMYKDNLVDEQTSIMQFSNILHLIYLSCQ